MENPWLDSSSTSWLLTSFSFTNILWWFFGVLAVIFIVHALVVFYHWYTFGTERIVPTIAIIAYTGVGGLILVLMLTTLTLG